MANLTSEEYFDKLQTQLATYEKKVRENSDNSAGLNLFCIEEERKYIPEAFETAVKIYNNLDTDEAKKTFGSKVVLLFGELASDKSKSSLAHYNDCKNIFDAIRGALLAKKEGKDFKEIDKLLADTYKYMKIPFVKIEGNGFIHLRNNVFDVVLPELKKAKVDGTVVGC